MTDFTFIRPPDPPDQPDGLVYDEATDRIIEKLTTKTCHRDGTTVGRTVGINALLTLLGRTRSPAMEDIGKQWNEWIGSGKFLYVTNWTEIRMLREVAVHARILTKLFITKVTQSRTRITWEYTISTDEGEELIAVAEQNTTFTKVLGHGHIEPAPMPQWLRVWLQRQCHLGNHPSRAIPGVEDVPTFPRIARPPGQVFHPPRFLYRLELPTTTLNSNLGGNVYYQNYFEWQIMVCDRYFHSVDPALFRNVGRDGEVLTVAARSDFLREIMPLDDVRLELSARSVGENWAQFEVSHFFRREGIAWTKAAVGTITVVFIHRDAEGTAHSCPWPDHVRAAILEGEAGEADAPTRRLGGVG